MAKKSSIVEELVSGDGIFKIHSIGATLFGSVLLFFPQILMEGNAIAEFAYQQWSIFILAIAAITFLAPGIVCSLIFYRHQYHVVKYCYVGI